MAMRFWREARESRHVMLEILAYERELHPGIFQNYTNGSWFSPWWRKLGDEAQLSRSEFQNDGRADSFPRWPKRRASE